MNNKKFISQLPTYFQTNVNKKFYEATIDQLYNKKDSKNISAYVGRKNGKIYNPSLDEYLLTGLKSRDNYTLEPCTYSIDYESLTKTDVCFYEDLVNYIKINGGNVSNHDRLFSANQYSYSPPIDIDKFVNYQSYYWIDDVLEGIEIAGLDDAYIEANIIGAQSFSTSDFEFTSGLKVIFSDSINYNQRFYVEGVGREISLVPELYSITSMSDYTYREWDVDYRWDKDTQWDLKLKTGYVDYITIERGCRDGNAWSRSNKWVHVDALTKLLELTNQPWPKSASRALRPIIEFAKDIELYNFGKQYIGAVDYIVNLSYSDVAGMSLSDFINTINNNVQTGSTFIFLNGNDYRVYVTEVDDVANTVSFNETVFRQYVINGQYENSIYIPSTGDVVVGKYGENATKTFVYNGVWEIPQNTKTKLNQPPLFALYDVEKNSLQSYNQSNFSGNKIFSYKLNEDVDARIDQILSLPIIYTGLGQIADIVFENDILTTRYQYISNNNLQDIFGYYLYKIGDVYQSAWHYTEELTKQYIIHEYVYSKDVNINTLTIGVDINTVEDITVEINGTLTNNYSLDVVNYKDSVVIHDSLNSNDFIKIRFYSKSALNFSTNGYYEIPKTLESNPLNAEVGDYTLNQLNRHFNDIISSQTGIEYGNLGQSNNYRDTKKDLSLGKIIIQSNGSLAYLMQNISGNLDLLSALEYSKNEYSKFKSKFINLAKTYTNTLPISDNNNIIDAILNSILSDINLARTDTSEFSNTRMIGHGDAYQTTNLVLNASQEITYDYNENTDHLYIWVENYNSIESSVFETATSIDALTLLSYNRDYVIENNEIVIINNSLFGKNAIIRYYTDIRPSFIPATPSKLGLYNSYVPKIMLDYSYTVPTWVIRGHDGSKIFCYSQIDENGIVIDANPIDTLILELEKRIYNSINSRFKSQDYNPALQLSDVLPTNTYNTDYSIFEIQQILFSQFNIWATKNKSNYMINNTYDIANWKSYNYTSAGLLGSWRNIYRFHYRTEHFNYVPWEMLGFSVKPSWWDTEYGISVNGKYNNTFISMWNDIKDGIIRSGNRQGTYEKYQYPMMSVIPVDANGDIIDIATYFNIPSGFYSYDAQWKYGDSSPVESAWVNSSEYAFSVVRLLALTKPALFSVQFWDTINNAFVSYENFSWLESKNIIEFKKDLGTRSNIIDYVTAEYKDDSLTSYNGYQVWVADSLLRDRKDITLNYGNKMRSLNISLGSKLGGYTNNSTFRAFLESLSSPNSDSLRIPENNIDILLHKGKPVDQYVYSGVVVRLTEDNKYAVYGYDNSSYSFKFYDIDTTVNPQIIKEGGVPAPYVSFEYGSFYNVNQIVRFNTLFYIANVAHQADSFDENNWTLLASLPTSGGVTVNLYNSNRNKILEISYGHIFNTVQDVFNFLNAYGDYLEDQGWMFNEVDSNNGYIINWFATSRQFLNWTVSSYAPGTVTFLNPVSNNINLKVSRGYPENVERIVNGFYSILDKTGLAIDPKTTIVSRDDQNISITSTNNEGLYMLRVLSAETEHIIVLDNLTSFDDIVYDPILSIRQNRIKISCTLSNNWFGKFEAPGYLIVGNELIPNYENLVSSIANYYNMDTLIDNQGIELAAKSIIGYQDRDYLNNLGINDELQFAFYQGFIKEKGTQNSIDKILRTDLIDSASSTEITEEWALKLGEYGNIDYSQIDILIDPKYTIAKNQIISIDKSDTNLLKVNKLSILTADVLYNSVPEILITPDPSDENVINIIPAKALAVIENRKLVNVILLSEGSGYTKTPNVIVADSTDKVYAIMIKDIQTDVNYDFQYIVNEYDTNRTLSVKPYNKKLDNIPTTDRNSIDMIVAGYVNLNDVDYFLYDIDDLINYNYDLRNKSLYIGNTYTKDWNVYTTKLATTEEVVLTQQDEFIKVEFNSYDPRYYGVSSTSSGIIYIEEIDNSFSIFSFKYDDEVEYIRLFNNNNDPVFYNDVLGKPIYVLYTLRYSINNTPDTFSRYWIDNINIAVAEITSVNGLGSVTSINVYNKGYYNSSPSYKVLSTGTNLNLDVIVNETGQISVTIIHAGINYQVGDRIIFSNTETKWAVVDNKTNIYRSEIKLIDSSKYAESYIYSYSSNETLARLPIYDPIKGLLPGPAEQNISYKSPYDPAKYNGDDTFGQSEIGNVWLDTSSCKFLWYEQPKSIDETEQDAIRYNKQNWGKVFPGSPVDVYEWIESKYRPDMYTEVEDDGIPFNNELYVTKSIYNSNTLDFENRYYYWVKNKKRKPNKKNRTLSTIEISNLLKNVQTSGYQCFAAIYSNQYDSYAIFNCDSILSNDVCALSIKYGNEYNYHTEWKLLSSKSKVFPDHLWDKLVDSLVGYTNPTMNKLHDSVETDDGYVLPVPDITLPKNDLIGLELRPRQTMFTDVSEARRELVSYINLKFSEILVSELYENIFLSRINWYKEGYNFNNTKPSKSVNSASEISLLNLPNGSIIRVLNSGQYVKIEDGRSEVVRVDNGTYSIKNEFYTTNSNIYHKDVRALFDILYNMFDIKEIFFLMTEYAFSETSIINWCFKSSYINVRQNNKRLSQKLFFTPSSDDNLLDYINETKPYHTKVRNFTSSLAPDLELATYTASDSYAMDIKVKFADVCDNVGWDMLPWDQSTWDPIQIDCKRGVILSAGDFSRGWDTTSWDTTAWDKINDYNTITGGLWDDNVEINITYNAGLFNSPGNNGAPREIYINGSVENIVINICTMNIPEDIDTNIYPISSSLIGTQVITPSGTYLIEEEEKIEVITYRNYNV